jgi:mono/diheme cytochrome c family protein
LVYVRFPALLLVVVAAAVFVAACEGNDGTPAEPDLTGEAARGRQLVEEQGCLSCHTTDGTDSTGPTWTGLVGSQVQLADGTTVVADDAYLLRSILEPDAQVVDGFPAGLMASAVPPGTLTRAEAEAIVAYLRTLEDAGNSAGSSSDS